MITELNVEHLAPLTSLEQQSHSGTSASQLLEALGSLDASVLGYWQAECLLGYAIVARLPFEAELQAIGVLPECRRRGAGQALINAVVETAQAWQSERLLLEVRVSNHAAIKLYRRSGFNEDGYRKGYYPAQGFYQAQGCYQTQGCSTAPSAAKREDALLMSRCFKVSDETSVT